MFSTLFESFFPSSLSCEEQQSRPEDITRSDTSTETVDTKEEGEQKVAELEQKQEDVQEDEDEEVEDQAVAIREACGNTKVCKPFLHHLEHCGERLAKGDTIVDNETCVEELFHFMHCVDDCAAPKVFAALK